MNVSPHFTDKEVLLVLNVLLRRLRGSLRRYLSHRIYVESNSFGKRKENLRTLLYSFEEEEKEHIFAFQKLICSIGGLYTREGSNHFTSLNRRISPNRDLMDRLIEDLAAERRDVRTYRTLVKELDPEPPLRLLMEQILSRKMRRERLLPFAIEGP